MTVQTGEAAGLFFGSPPDVCISMPEAELRRAMIRRACVAVHSMSGTCPNGHPEADPGWDPQILAGRHVDHYTNVEAAGSMAFEVEGFTTVYRGKCFDIQTYIERSRFNDEMPEGEKRAIRRRQTDVAAHLMRVLRTVVFLDKSPAPPEVRAAELVYCDYGSTSQLLTRGVCEERKRQIQLAKRNPGVLLKEAQANLDSVEQEIQRLDAQPVTADLLKQLGEARNRLPAAQGAVQMARELEDVAAHERATEEKTKHEKDGPVA